VHCPPVGRWRTTTAVCSPAWAMSQARDVPAAAHEHFTLCWLSHEAFLALRVVRPCRMLRLGVGQPMGPWSPHRWDCIARRVPPLQQPGRWCTSLAVVKGFHARREVCDRRAKPRRGGRGDENNSTVSGCRHGGTARRYGSARGLPHGGRDGGRAARALAQLLAVCRRSKWSKHVTNSPCSALLAMVGSDTTRKMSSACSHALC
jgi:hypothetical protein